MREIINLIEPLNERVVDINYDFLGKDVAFRAHVDPNFEVLTKLVQTAKHHAVRGLVGDGHVYVWDASAGNHYEVAKALGFDPQTFRGYGGPTSFWVVTGRLGRGEAAVWAQPKLVAPNGLKLVYEPDKETVRTPAFQRLLRQFS